jgi:hypothetical protein
MKSKPVKLITALAVLMVISCNEPETIVTDYVHKDGSVTRRIEMRSISEKIEDRFRNSDLQVPFDSTWTVRDSTELSKKGDSIWVRRAEKYFKNADEINATYKLDSGANKKTVRHAIFKKRFKWFNTEFRFSEAIDKNLTAGYPIKDFLNNEELNYFYSPESYKDEKMRGPDSLKFKSLDDSISSKTDQWTYKNVVSEWITEFTNLTRSAANNEISLESLKPREDDLVKIVKENSPKFDSLWKKGLILRQFIGEKNAMKYKTEADSAMAVTLAHVLIDFKEYSVRIVMPGKLAGTNGFIDSSKVLLWPVKADYFMSQPYEMWAESRVPNKWAWFISGLFLVFVLSGIIIRIIKKG